MPPTYKLVALCAAIAVSSSASAASGWIRFTAKYWEHNGGFCDLTQPTDPSRDCTGSRYPKSQFQTQQFLRRLNFYVNDGGNAGQAATDQNGVVSIHWDNGFFGSCTPTVFIATKWANGDNRFTLKNTTGGDVTTNGSSVQLTCNTTQSNPQVLGDWVAGTSSTPHDYANLYGSAMRTWDRIWVSSILSSNFTGLQIWAFNTSNDTSSDRANNRVYVSTAGKLNVWNVAHEMGHIAEVKIKSGLVLIDYCYPTTYPCSGQSQNGHFWNGSAFIPEVGPEWRATAFTEGFADFVGTTVLYDANAPQPTFCERVSGPCFTTDPDLGPSFGSGSCPTDEARSERSTARMLWDIFDSVSDSSYTDSLNLSFDAVVENIAAYPSGRNDHQHEEPYNSSGAVDDRDGRDQSDYEYNAINKGSSAFNPSSQRSNNCG